MNATKVFDRETSKRVEKAITKAEERTSAELIGVVATESDRYDRAESLAGLFLGLVVLGIVHALHAGNLFTPGSWGNTGGVGFFWQVLSVVSGFIAGSVVTSYWHGLRRLMVSADHKSTAVENAAWQVFAMERLRHTRQRSGVLVYVSLFERKVSILADTGAHEAIGQEGLEELKELAAGHLRDGDFEAAFVETVQRAAEALEDAFPPEETETTERSDRLRIFHPRP